MTPITTKHILAAAEPEILNILLMAARAQNYANDEQHGRAYRQRILSLLKEVNQLMVEKGVPLDDWPAMMKQRREKLVRKKKARMVLGEIARLAKGES